MLVHPGYFFDFPREAFVVREPAAGAGGVRRRRGAPARPRGGAGVSAPIPRQSGIGVPLFSLVSSRSWGIGEFADLPAFGGWCSAAGQRYVQLLPLNEISPGETSPYSSMSAMALDPIYIRLGDVADFAALGGETALDADDRRLARRAADRAADPLREVRTLKMRWLRRAYRALRGRRAGARPRRGPRRSAPIEAGQSWWLDAYATFRAIHAAHEERAWWDWPPALAVADPEAVREAATALAEERRYRAYLQWIAEEQWQAARTAAGVRVFGDLPFMVSGDSPDVWARTQEFMLDATVGVPPDAFSDTGQDWGLPPWRWQAMQATGFQWMRARARRTAALFDGVRIDHLVGLYRIYVRPTDETLPKVFSPPDERDAEPARRDAARHLPGQRRRGGGRGSRHRARLRPLVDRRGWACQGSRCCAGSGSGASRRSRSSIPAAYPDVSVALSGTHDTEAMTRVVGGGAGAAAGVAARRCAACRRKTLRQSRTCRRCATRCCARCWPAPRAT